MDSLPSTSNGRGSAERAELLSRIRPLLTVNRSFLDVHNLSLKLDDITVDDPPQLQTDFTSKQFANYAETFDIKARKLKHLGDDLIKDTNTNEAQRVRVGLLYLTQSLLFFLLTFWCQDQVEHKFRYKKWTSIFPMTGVIKRLAKKNDLPLFHSLCQRIEYLLRLAIYDVEQRHLRNQYLAYREAIAQNPTSPVSLKPDMVQQTTRGIDDFFVIERMWDESLASLEPRRLQEQFPQTWKLCCEQAPYISPKSFVFPLKPYKFAWALDARNTSHIPHVVAFFHSILEEWVTNNDVEYTFATLDIEL